MVENNQKFYYSSVFINFLLIIVTALLFTLKIILSLISNSLALQADAFDNLTDIVMYIAALVGTFYAKKKPNEKFPYGYYRIENIISLIISILIFITAYNIILESVSEFAIYFKGESKEIIISPIIFLFLIISLIISICSAIYLKLTSKKINSPIINSEANEKLLDCLISLSVIFGFVSALFNFFLLDSIIGFIISIIIIKGAYDIFLHSTKVLLDAVIDFENRAELYKLIENYPRIKKVENLQVRSYGKYIMLEIDVVLNKEMPLSQIKALKNTLSSRIKKNYPQIFKIIIFAQAQEKKITKIAVPIADNEGVNSRVFDHFGEAPLFAFLEFKENNFKKMEINSNKFINEEKRKGILISDWLTSEKIDKIYLKKELKQGPKLVFDNSFVEVILTQLKRVKEIIDTEIKS
ncbi:MAG: cation diffusion facilitator family transporter [Promethearchaeota archaeon]